LELIIIYCQDIPEPMWTAFRDISLLHGYI